MDVGCAHPRHGRRGCVAPPSEREAQGSRAAACAAGTASFSCRDKKSNPPHRAEQKASDQEAAYSALRALQR